VQEARRARPPARIGHLARGWQTRPTMQHPPRTFLALAAALSTSALPGVVMARSAGDPIVLRWNEADVAGFTAVYGPDAGRPIGTVEYHQKRDGDVLSATRVTRFTDGSSDEDTAEARVAGRLESLGGRSIIRDPDGETTVDLTIDVANGRLAGSWGRGDARQTVDRVVDLPPGTYWGPLIFIVLKNFDGNAEDGQLTFRTVAPTPRPIVLDMVLTREGEAPVERPGMRLDTARYTLGPTVHWMLDPVIRLFAPRAEFWVLPDEPPALARFAGPRNYRRQPIVIQ
jgi:hypothetical protein